MPPVSYVDATAGAVEHCEKWSREYPDLAEKYFAPLADACQRKLWHQLTLLVHELVHDPSASRSDAASGGVHLYWGVYHEVVLAVETKLNSLSLAVIAARVSEALVSSSSVSHHPDWTAAKALLENLLDKLQQQQQQQAQNQLPELLPSGAKSKGAGGGGVDPQDQAVLVYVQSKLALLSLQEQLQSQPATAAAASAALTKESLRDVTKAVKGTADQLAQLGDAAALLDPRVYAAHHELAWQYYKVVGPPEEYCRSALAFLQYQSPPPASGASTFSMTASSYWLDLGVDLCWAALTGEGVYADLHHVATVAHDLIPPTDPQRPLVDLVQAVADGLVAEGRALFEQIARTQPSVQHWQCNVWEKLSLLALVQLAFDKPAHERALTFEEISDCLAVDTNDVELIVMRACSVGLLEATLDQVEQTVVVKHAVPRRLQQPEALRALAARYGAWAQQVQTMHQSMRQAWTDNNSSAEVGNNGKAAQATAAAAAE